MYKSFLIICLMSVIPLFANAQEEIDLKPYLESRKKISLNGMKALGTWGGVSLASGIAGSIYTDGSQHYFHQMNALWGAVNVLASRFASKSIEQETYPTDPDKLEMDQLKLERTFYFSAALDVAYVGAGFGLLSWSRSEDLNKDRLEGYGYSFIVQGAFILVLDATMYFLHKKNRKKRLAPAIRKDYYMN